MNKWKKQDPSIGTRHVDIYIRQNQNQTWDYILIQRRYGEQYKYEGRIGEIRYAANAQEAANNIYYRMYDTSCQLLSGNNKIKLLKLLKDYMA